MIQPLYSPKVTQETPVQEFSIEIPDAEADEIQTVQQGKYALHYDIGVQLSLARLAIDYIAKTPEGRSTN